MLGIRLVHTLVLLGLVACSGQTLASSPPVTQSPRKASEPGVVRTGTRPPPSAGPIGTAHPTVLQAAAPDGSWVVVCQARRDSDGDGEIWTRLGMHGDFYGDDLAAYLVTSSGSGEPLDSFVGADPNFRYLAFVQQGQLKLLDTLSGTRIDLAANGNDDDYPLGPHRAASFDEDGKRFLYLRNTSSGERAYVRELDTGTEWAIDHGQGQLWRAYFVGNLVLALVRPPGQPMVLPTTTLAVRHCRGPVGSYSTFGQHGTPPERRLLPPKPGPPVELEGVLMVRGDWVLRQNKDQSISWQRGTTKRTIVPASCSGEVLAVLDGGGPVVASCATRASKQRDVVWYGRNTSKTTPIKVNSGDRDRILIRRVSYHWVDRQSYYIDIHTGRTMNLGVETAPVASYGDKTYVHRRASTGRHKEWFGYIDWSTGKIVTLPYMLPSYPKPRIAGRWLTMQAADSYHAGPVVDMETGEVVGSAQRDPLAMTLTGYVLMSSSVSRSTVLGPPFAGPLRWYKPGPPPAAPYNGVIGKPMDRGGL